MQVKDLMATDITTVSANDTVDTAVTLMASADIGAIPVTDNGKLIGLLSDRDITSRLVAQQRDAAATPVTSVMSERLHYCHGTDDAADIARKLACLDALCMPVVDQDKQLIGMVTLRSLSSQAGRSGTGGGHDRDDDLDEALDETFPASDPISPA